MLSRIITKYSIYEVNENGVYVKGLDKDEEQDIYYMVYSPSVYTKELVTLFPIRGKSNAIQSQKRLQDAIEARQIEVDMKDLDGSENPYRLINSIRNIIGLSLLVIIITFIIFAFAC